MAATPFFTTSFRGLCTSKNRLADTYSQTAGSSINAPAVTDGGMLVARNIVIAREGIVEPRHGLAQVRQASGTQSNISGNLNYEYKASHLWVSTDQATSAVILPRTTNSADYISVLSGSSTANLNTWTFTQSNMLAFSVSYTIADNNPIFDPSTDPDYNVPRFFEAKDVCYVMAQNGVWGARSDTPSVALTNGFTRQLLPRIGSITAAMGSGGFGIAPNLWLGPYNEVCFIALISRPLPNGRVLYGRPSATCVFRNTVYTYTAVDITVKTGNFVQPGDTIELYMCAPYPQTLALAVPPIEQFVLCAKKQIPSTHSAFASYTVTPVGDTSNLPGVTSLPLEFSASGKAIRRGVEIPIARDVTKLTGYAFYANIKSPAIAEMVMTRLPANNETLTISTASGTAVDLTVTFKTTASAATDVQIAANSTQAEAAVSLNLDFDGTETNKTFVAGDVYPDMYFTVVPAASVADEHTFVVDTTAGTHAFLDRNKYPTTGGVLAISKSGLSDNVITLLSYQSTSTTIVAGSITFLGCTYVGTKPQSLTFPGTYYLWPIDASNIAGIQFYGVPFTAGLLVNNFGLSPSTTLNNFKDPVATVAKNIGSFSVVGGELVCNMTFYGHGKRFTTRLTRDTITNLCNTINKSTTGHFYAEPVPGDDQAFTIESYLPTVTAVWARSSVTDLFSPILDTTNNTQISSDAHFKNGLAFSYLNQPETVSRASILAPEPIGSSARRILRLAATATDLFAFKEREGIYRITVQGGGDLPIITSSLILDNTTFLAASESVQVLDGAVYFLSQKGFRRLTTAGIDILDDDIFRDVLQALAKTPSLDLVRSFCSEFRKIYGCYFPRCHTDGTGQLFVYNVRRAEWTTWDDVSFDDFVRTIDDRLVFVTKDYLLNPVCTNTTAAAAAVVDTTFSWQYLRQEVFTGQDPNADIDQVEESIFIPVDSAVGTLPNITITLTGVTRTGPLDDLKEMTPKCRTKQLWFNCLCNAVTQNVPVTIANYGLLTAGVTSITVVMPSWVTSFDEGYYLWLGVNTDIQFRPFHAGTPQLNKAFSEAGVTVQDSTPTNVILSFQVDAQTTFSSETDFSTVVAEQGQYRALIPVEASRGRFLITRFQHSVPKERFSVNGLAITYNSTNSTATSVPQS